MTTIENDNDFESANFYPHVTEYEYFNSNDVYGMQNVMMLDLSQRATPPTSFGPHHSTYILDTAIRVQVVSDAFRASKAAVWEEKKSNAKTWSLLSGAVAIGFAVGAFATSGFWATAFGVAAVGTLILAAINITKMNEASRQVAGWNHSPLLRVAETRAKAYANGFPYALSHDLKLLDPKGSTHAVLLPCEVHFLYERHFDDFCQKLLHEGIPYTEQDKKVWLDHFTRFNPVSIAALTYAHDGFMLIPEKYRRVSNDYEVLYGQLSDIRHQFSNLRSQRERETKEIIRGINANRNLALLPFDTMLHHWLEVARSERDINLAAAKTNEERVNINSKYETDTARYRTYHLLSIAPVNIYYDSQISSAKSQLKNILAEIKRNEASSHAPFFNYARSMLEFAWRTKSEPDYVYQPQTFAPEAIFHVPTPSAPPIEAINFMDQARTQIPQNLPQGQYTEYVRFVSWTPSQPEQRTGT